MGLWYNLHARDVHFPNWQIWVYTTQRCSERDPLFQYLQRFGKKLNVKVVISSDHATNPVLWRYQPMNDHSVDFCLIRDIDSILTANDAKYVELWIKDETRSVLVYSEYKMEGVPQGGGFSIKPSKLKLPDFNSTLIKAMDRCAHKLAKRDTGLDEFMLRAYMKQVPVDQVTTIITRKQQYNGVYHSVTAEEIKSSTPQDFRQSLLLDHVWNLPHLHAGYGPEAGKQQDDRIVVLREAYDELCEKLSAATEIINIPTADFTTARSDAGKLPWSR